jgi:2-keto-4-pentenoate hydratase/2-oxohepta-3-ene-1,7-dioic acid hydratase in catechol pathway
MALRLAAVDANGPVATVRVVLSREDAMKLLRYGPPGEEKPGCLDADDAIRDLSAIIADVAGGAIDPDRLRELARVDLASLPAVAGTPRLGPPVAGIRKILGIGLNYRSHAEETGATPPPEPMLFSKAITSLSGPYDPIVIPRNSVKTDWEVELAVIVGRRMQYVEEADALSFVAGYALINDVSEREFQKERGGQFVKGKSADSFAPIGPWLLTADEVTDPQDVDLWLDVNGRRRQTGNTGDMIFSVAHVLSHLSQFMTLEPGDVIATGTPSGVGAGCKPPEYLKPGDVVTLGSPGFGEQRHAVVAWQAAAA